MQFIKINLGYKVFFVTLFLVMTSFFSFIAVSHIESNSKKNIHKALGTVLDTTQEALHLWLDEQRKNVIGIAQEKDIINYTMVLIKEYGAQKDLTNNSSMLTLRQLMAKYHLHNQGIDFSIIAPDRVVIATMQNSRIGAESNINKQRKHHLDQVFFGKTVFIPTIQNAHNERSGQSNNLTSIFIASPILDSSGNIKAALAIHFDPNTNFSRILQLGRIGSTGESYAFDSKGILITKSRFDHHLKVIDEKSMILNKVADPGGNLLDGYISSTPQNKRPLTLMARRAIKGDFSAYIDAYRDYRGVEVFGVWEWDDVFDIGITAEIDKQEALLPNEQTKIVIITT